VHDKQVRRRRAVLGLLVGASLILLTAYFGESPSSPLHAVQRGIVEVFSPIQTGASKVLSPVGDIAGWFSSTFRAKSQVARLTKENHYLVKQVDALQYEQFQNQQLRKLVKLDGGVGDISAYGPVTANVIERDPTLWYQTIEVDKGSADGVQLYDPVVGPGGLVGNVSDVGPNFSVVNLITNQKFAVTALVEDAAGDTGVLLPALGNVNQLLLTSLPSHAQINTGQQVVTAGFTDKVNPALRSLYPPGIPIGQVASANQNTLINNQEVTVTPAADIRHMSLVQILTRPTATAPTQRTPQP
jgi:rod shape-determining protein MreC